MARRRADDALAGAVSEQGCRPQPVAVAGCLGWLHLPPPGRALGRAVLVCPPWGYEALAAYRGLYELAQGCAAAGLPTLRLDLPNTGDSPGEDAPGSMEAARAAILAASAWLTENAGVAEVALCGVRYGALVAASAAALHPGRFRTMALLAPVWSGQRYAREVLLAARTTGRETKRWLEAAGERLHRADINEFLGSNLAENLGRAEPSRLLVLSRACASPGALSECGEVTMRAFAGADALLGPPHAARLPVDELSQVADWLATGAPPPAGEMRQLAAPRLPAGDGTVEHALRFGPDDALAGVLCEPAAGPRRGLAALILNSGAEPRAGVGRFGTRLARHLAAIGVTSLRMDATGVGDSDPVPGAADHAEPPDMYRDALVDEARAGLDSLARTGASRCLVIGICSGAHVALQLAIRDQRASGLALLNLPAFDRSAGGAPALDGGPPPGETPLLRRPRMLVRRLLAEFDTCIARLSGLETGLNRPGRWMRELSARGAHVLLAYSERDRGLRELRAHFGRRGRRLAGMQNIRVAMLEGTDHSIAPRDMQAQALRLIEREALLLDGAPAARARTSPRPSHEALGGPFPGASLPAG
jgi:pimeloyl-ACP methyl ester carboxylesterase